MGQDFRGDPASAMLEVLDPEQNATFSDHYLEVEYDLSNVMFITTANSYNMPRPLLDRMEIIPIPGYTEDEKIEIAKQHLIAKQEKGHGLKPAEFELTDEGLRDIVRYYTREAGVRNLEREIAKLCRKAVTEIVKGKSDKVVVTPREPRGVSSASGGSSTASPRPRTRSASSPASPGPRSAATSCRSRR